jgi:hypothetical protein
MNELFNLISKIPFYIRLIISVIYITPYIFILLLWYDLKDIIGYISTLGALPLFAVFRIDLGFAFFKVRILVLDLTSTFNKMKDEFHERRKDSIKLDRLYLDVKFMQGQLEVLTGNAKKIQDLEREIERLKNKIKSYEQD